jgi:hypothetical protein
MKGFMKKLTDCLNCNEQINMISLDASPLQTWEKLYANKQFNKKI